MDYRGSLLLVIVVCIVTSAILFHQLSWGPSFSLFSVLLNGVRLNASEQYVVYECDGSFPCGGWADRQKGIVSAYVLSQMMGRRYRIRITSPCDLSTHLMSNEIPWEITDDELRRLSVHYVQVLDKKGKQLSQKMSTMILEDQYQADVIYFTSNMEFVGNLLMNSLYWDNTDWLRNMSIPELYANVLKMLFKLKAPLQSQLGNVYNSIPRNNGVKLVCAQVRLGRNPTIPDDSTSFNTMKSVSAVWEFLGGYNIMSKFRIFVSSDSEDVRGDARKRFPSTIVDIEGDIVHVDRTHGSTVCEGFAKVILDQLLLSTCDVLVISRSGLGRIASWYRGKNESLYCFTESKVKRCNPFHLQWLIPSW